MHIGGTGGLRRISVLAALMLLGALTSTACSDLRQRPVDASALTRLCYRSSYHSSPVRRH